MSQDTSIDIKTDDDVNFFQVLIGFLNTGWNLNDYGQIKYLKLGGDEGDWVTTSLEEQDQVMEIIKQKSKLNEINGIVVMWKDTLIGGLLLYYPGTSTKEICFQANRNRKTLNSNPSFNHIGDFSWYLERLLLPFVDQKIHVYGIQANDYC